MRASLLPLLLLQGSLCARVPVRWSTQRAAARRCSVLAYPAKREACALGGGGLASPKKKRQKNHQLVFSFNTTTRKTKRRTYSLIVSGALGVGEQ
jgi:hypothetical protein